MSTVIAPDLGPVIKVNGVCYEKGSSVEEPPTVLEAPQYSSCPDCDGAGEVKKCFTQFDIYWSCESGGFWDAVSESAVTWCLDESDLGGAPINEWIPGSGPCSMTYYKDSGVLCDSDNECSPDTTFPTRPSEPTAVADCCDDEGSTGSEGSGGSTGSEGSQTPRRELWEECPADGPVESKTFPVGVFDRERTIKSLIDEKCFTFSFEEDGVPEDIPGFFEEQPKAPTPPAPNVPPGGLAPVKDDECTWCEYENVEFVEILDGVEAGGCEAPVVMTKTQFSDLGEPNYISYIGRCYRLTGGTNNPDNLNGAAVAQGSQCACVADVQNYNVKWGECANNPEGRPAFVVKQWNYNPLGDTLEQNFGCYAEPTNKCASITCEPTTEITQGPITYNGCENCTGEGVPSNEGPPEGGGGGDPGGGGSDIGGSTIPEESEGSTPGAGSVSPEICDVVCPEATLEMVSGAFIGSTSVFSSSFDLTSISVGGSITKNSGYVATNHAVISSMTVTKRDGGLIDIIVDYAFAVADNRLSGGQVSYIGVATNVLNINDTKAGVSGDVGDVEVTLEGTPCCTVSSGSSAGSI